ncbi:hypothetical protein [Chitinophaga polysaccharea]|nr:hypothetical protein [Chitinophaga polysaccharea]
MGLVYANKNDSLKVILNNKVMIEKVIKEEYDGHFESKKDRLATWCISEDSVLVKIIFNSRDTSFYLHPKLIKGWYVGCDLQKYIDIYYDYEKGGLGDYAPFR